MQDMPKNYFYSMALGRDLKGYSIGPHTDTADKWVTTLYYLPRYVGLGLRIHKRTYSSLTPPSPSSPGRSRGS